MPGEPSQEDMNLLPATSTKHSAPVVKISLRKNCTVVLILSYRSLAQKFCLRRETGHKPVATNPFPKKLIPFATEKFKPKGTLKNSGSSGKRQAGKTLDRLHGDISESVGLVVCQRETGNKSWEEPSRGENKSQTLTSGSIP